MNYNKIDPVHRLQVEKLEKALFLLMIEPTKYRVIVELCSTTNAPVIGRKQTTTFI